MTSGWVYQAAADRLHPTVIGFVRFEPNALTDHSPGTWDAVSDCLGPPPRPLRVVDLLGREKAGRFLCFAEEAACLPSAATTVSNRTRFPRSPALAAVLAIAAAAHLSDMRDAGEEVSERCATLLAHATREMGPASVLTLSRILVEVHRLPVADAEAVGDTLASVLGSDPLRRRR